MRAVLTEVPMRVKEGYLRNYRREPQAQMDLTSNVQAFKKELNNN